MIRREITKEVDKVDIEEVEEKVTDIINIMMREEEEVEEETDPIKAEKEDLRKKRKLKKNQLLRKNHIKEQWKLILVRRDLIGPTLIWLET